ncbi:hypothetical protein FRACYDRAFT_265616 [Fragilariopsis cylindrus CCMP1102]|uniref:Uncharacterized protein n=1 Tax=Fragilariopsis cylindrus CCMP1102 TaxID=635003 RepID=A0A1E7ELC7_9STRA|nr:hypothetical protein FRACYDRAFT_265616 [Fragilariopsis cylindrus CCMP1102]|eukprot:OEU06720.1 hypothetical protein FRACYDRAFT_265616 [Fragilariopsis cylindrus CCMP1102]
MMCPADNISSKKKKNRGKKKKVDHSQYKKGKELSSLPSASRDDSSSTSKENFDESVSTLLSYQVNSTLTLTSTSTSTLTSTPGSGAEEKMNEDEIKEEEDVDEEEEKIFNKSDKQIYYRVVEKVDNNNNNNINNNNSNNNRNSVRKKKKGRKNKDKVEWEASVACDTSSTTKINASCRDSSIDDQQNGCIQTSTRSITSSIISDVSTGSNNRSNPDFSFRVLKEQRNSYMHRLLKKDGGNDGSSSFQSSSCDEKSDSSVINSKNNETSFYKPISRSELREDLNAQVSARFETQDERLAEDVRTSIRRAISKNGGLDGDEESGNGNNDNKEDADDGDEIVNTRSLKRLADIMISRRGYIVFVAICVCLLLIGNILLIVRLVGS